MAAEMLSITVPQLDWAVRNDDQLRALYGARAIGGEVPVVRQEDTHGRSPEDLPDGVMPTKGMQWVELVSEQDIDLIRKGLKGMGLSEGILDNIKQMGKMAKSGGSFLAAALQITHQSYFASTMETFELSRRVKKILDDDEKEADPAKKLSHDDKRAYYEIYLEMQGALGQAYNLNLKGSEAIFRITMAANRRNIKTRPSKPGFGAMAAESADGES